MPSLKVVSLSFPCESVRTLQTTDIHSHHNEIFLSPLISIAMHEAPPHALLTWKFHQWDFFPLMQTVPHQINYHYGRLNTWRVSCCWYRPVYRYERHIELIRFKEYYGMPRGMSTMRCGRLVFSIYINYYIYSLYISREKGDHYSAQTRHNDLFSNYNLIL